MNELKLAEKRQVLGKEFKIYGSVENPLFLAKDVATWIEHSKVSMMLSSVDEGEKLMQTMFTSGQNRDMWFLTEDGLYEVLMQSRKPIAKEFKKQVKLILKDIRKHGLYAKDELLNDPDLFISALQELKEARQAKYVLEAKIEQDKPFTTFGLALGTTDSAVKLDQYSKSLANDGIKIGRNQLFSWLRKEKYLNKNNEPYQCYIKQGLFRMKPHVVKLRSSEEITTYTTLITGKGQKYFYEKLKAKAV